jgi:hypothetical protein
MKDVDLDADFVQQVHRSALRLLGTVHHDDLPDGGVYDVDIVDDTGLGLATVRASLLGLGEEELDVHVQGDDEPWVVRARTGS